MSLAGLEPATFRVWGGRDNHYTTKTYLTGIWKIIIFILILISSDHKKIKFRSVLNLNKKNSDSVYV